MLSDFAIFMLQNMFLGDSIDVCPKLYFVILKRSSPPVGAKGNAVK
jgi:hypothetical protein